MAWAWTLSLMAKKTTMTNIKIVVGVMVPAEAATAPHTRGSLDSIYADTCGAISPGSPLPTATASAISPGVTQTIIVVPSSIRAGEAGNPREKCYMREQHECPPEDDELAPSVAWVGYAVASVSSRYIRCRASALMSLGTSSAVSTGPTLMDNLPHTPSKTDRTPAIFPLDRCHGAGPSLSSPRMVTRLPSVKLRDLPFRTRNALAPIIGLLANLERNDA